MNLSNFLAELWGIIITIVSLTLLINLKQLEKLFVKIENKATIFFFGIITLIIGITIVLVHNVWALDWRVSITIFGWLTLLKGLDLLFFPERMKKRWPKMKKWQWLLIFTSLFLFGLILSYLGFTN